MTFGPCHRLLHAFTIVLVAATAPAWGVTPMGQPPSRALSTYAATGTLASVSSIKPTLTISGTEYRYLPSLRVVSAMGTSLTLQDLSPGQSVAYTIDAGSLPGQPYVTEIRLLAGPGRKG